MAQRHTPISRGMNRFRLAAMAAKGTIEVCAANGFQASPLPEKGQALVADEPQGKTRQDRREDRDPCPVRHIPDGRSRGAKTAVR